jgi:hypothetical protein
LGERLLCKQEVIGSIPFTSTISRRLMVPDSGNAVTARGGRVASRDGLLKRSWKYPVCRRLRPSAVFFDRVKRV